MSALDLRPATAVEPLPLDALATSQVPISLRNFATIFRNSSSDVRIGESDERHAERALHTVRKFAAERERNGATDAGAIIRMGSKLAIVPAQYFAWILARDASPRPITDQARKKLRALNKRAEPAPVPRRRGRVTPSDPRKQ